MTAGDCSAPVTIELRDNFGNPTSAASNTSITLNTSGVPLSFSTNSGCSPTTTSVSVAQGSSTVSFRYTGTVAGTASISGTATGLTPTPLSVTVTAGAPSALVFTTGPQTLLAGTCSNLRTVETWDAFGNVATNGATITLSGSTAAEFFQDPNCTTPITGPITIPAGNSTTSFYFKGFTGGINANGSLMLTASATGLTSATQAETIIPTVRTGSCVLSNTQVDCAITPPLLEPLKAFLVFQATSTNTASEFANVRCFVNTVSQVTCQRTGNGGNDVNIGWSVAEFPSGVTVESLNATCTGDSTPVFTGGFTMNRTFLLLSSQRAANNIAGSSTRLAEVVATNQAYIRKAGGCGGVIDNNVVQVVQFAGAEVQRGLATMANGATSTQANLPTPVAPERSILLYSYIADSTTTKICDRAVRGELAVSGGSVSFSRGEGDTTNCAGSAVTGISWEVVQFPAGTVVQQVTQQLPGGPPPSFVTAAISPVDMSRTLVIGGGQWASGQLHGEGRYSSSEIIGEMRVQAFLVDNDTVGFYRDSSNNSATFTAYVIQFKP